jgi:hypothetical protein
MSAVQKVWSSHVYATILLQHGPAAHPSEMPQGRKATYLCIVSALKAHKTEIRRIRFTAGGNRIEHTGKVSTPTADPTAVKCLLNSVLSTPDAKFITMDIKDFYLNTPMARFEHMQIPVRDIPEIIMQNYQLHDKVHNGYVLVEIRKGMCGLPQAGIIAKNRLVKHLATSPSLSTILVSNVLAKNMPNTFSTPSSPSAQPPMIGTAPFAAASPWIGTAPPALSTSPCRVTSPKPSTSQFCHPTPTRPQHLPHAWNKPNYGQPTQLTAPEDTSEPLTPAGLTRLQKVVGVLLHHARAVDHTLPVALGTIASAQSKGTKATAQAVTQLLNYCATHPDATPRYIASDMHLHVHSDASYLSELKARSRAGGDFFLSDTPIDLSASPDINDPPPPHNGAIHTHGSIIRAVLSSATEAELGALFVNAKDATVMRNTLDNLGHPQSATPIQTDNSCAAGIANDTVKQRRSKAINMHFCWIKDRVNKGEFVVHWRRGTDNPADYFTKHHSPA